MRTTNMSECIASMLRRVSSSVSPLVVADVLMLKLITSADSILPRVQRWCGCVLFSKNRLVMMRPRSSGTFFTGRPGRAANDSAVSRICNQQVAAQALNGEEMAQSAVFVELQIAFDGLALLAIV